MTNIITIGGTFTKNIGEPATGLTLSDIKFYLTASHRLTGENTIIWDGTQIAQVEKSNVGAYIRLYEDADSENYHYFSRIVYEGVEVLDIDNVYGEIAAIDAQDVIITNNIAWFY